MTKRFRGSVVCFDISSVRVWCSPSSLLFGSPHTSHTDSRVFFFFFFFFSSSLFLSLPTHSPHINKPHVDPHGVTAVVWLHHDHLLATACAFDGIINTWDCRKLTAEPVHRFQPSGSERRRGISSMAVDSTHTVLAACSLDDCVYVYDTLRSTSAPVLVGSGYSNESFYVKCAFSPHDDLLLAGASDGVAAMWQVDRRHWDVDVTTPTSSHSSSQRAPAFVLAGHAGEVSGVTWQRDAQAVATCSDDCTVRVWHRQY
jgi:WD40 repeat protein